MNFWRRLIQVGLFTAAGVLLGLGWYAAASVAHRNRLELLVYGYPHYEVRVEACDPHNWQTAPHDLDPFTGNGGDPSSSFGAAPVVAYRRSVYVQGTYVGCLFDTQVGAFQPAAATERESFARKRMIGVWGPYAIHHGSPYLAGLLIAAGWWLSVKRSPEDKQRRRPLRVGALAGFLVGCVMLVFPVINPLAIATDCLCGLLQRLLLPGLDPMSGFIFAIPGLLLVSAGTGALIGCGYSWWRGRCRGLNR